MLFLQLFSLTFLEGKMLVARKRQSNQEIFLEHINSLIRNFLVTNVNYTNGYYDDKKLLEAYEIIGLEQIGYQAFN